MARTLATLRTGVRMYLDESAQSDFLDTEVDREINYAYHDLISEVVNVNEDYYLTTTPKYITTVANTQEYTLDSGLTHVRRVEINYKPSDSNSVAVRAIPVELDELPRRLADNNSGGGGLFNSGYYIIGKQSAAKIGFVPIPTDGGTNAVSVWGIELPSDLSSSTDPVDIPYADRFAKLIELKAAAELLRKGQQAEKEAAQYMKEYLLAIQRMKEYIQDRTADGVNMIEDTLYEDIQFDYQI